MHGGHRGRRDGPQHEVPFLVPEYGTTTVKGLSVNVHAGALSRLYPLTETYHCKKTNPVRVLGAVLPRGRARLRR